MINLILFLAGVFLLTFIIGRILEKIHIPWIFSALFLGIGLAAFNPFTDLTSSSSFTFLAEMGMYFLLFIIGFELNLKEIFNKKLFIVKTTAMIIFFEALVGSLVLHSLFDIDWVIAILVATSFATVGEEVLLPILDEFKLVKTKLGQTILSVGVLDDVVEVITILVASVLIGRSAGHGHYNIFFNILILIALFAGVFLMIKLKKYFNSFKYKDISSLFIFVIFFLFLFVGIGKFVEAAALGALLAGIALRNLLPDHVRSLVDSEVKTMAYGFFAPVFFLWAGVGTDVGYLITYPLLIVGMILMINATKILASYIAGKKELGTRKSIIMGISLCVKFSTSIVIIKFLFERGLIGVDLFSILVGTTVAFKFIIPLLLSFLIQRWNIGKKSTA